MTNEEAKKIMVSAMCRVNDMPPSVVEAFRMYQDAFEKQMPKKVKGKYPFYCPSCGTKLSPGPYCWKCGQRVEFERREVKV